MKIFIGWSGKRSHAMAIALKKWLEALFQGVLDVSVCSNSKPGRIWWNEIEDALKSADGAILCMTPESTASTWLPWEASQIYNKKKGFVIPYCLDIDPKKIDYPLGLFQALKAIKDDTWELVCMINKPQERELKDEKCLLEKFNNTWGDLSERLDKISKERTTEKGDSHLRQFESEIMKLSSNQHKAMEIIKMIPMLANDQRIIIALCGSAAIGKSTFADLIAFIANHKRGYTVSVLPTDAYTLSRAEKKEKKLQGYEPDSHKLDELRQNVWDLIEGRPVPIHPYQHEDGTFGAPRIVEPAAILIVEGVYSFEPMIYHKIKPPLKGNEKVSGLLFYLDAEPGKAQELKFAADVTRRNKSVEEAFDQMNANYDSYDKHIKKKYYKYTHYSIEVKKYWAYA